MIMFVNTITLSGHLIDEPEITSHDIKDSNGGRSIKKAVLKLQFFVSQNTTSEIVVVCWGKQAEEAEKFLKKASQIVVSGLFRGYEGSFEITAKTLSFEEKANE